MAEEHTPEGVLVNAAKVIGKAAGKVAWLAGAKGDPSTARPRPGPDASVSGRLPKKNKSRLPRKLKKRQKKAA